MSNIVHGRNLIIFIDDVAIAANKSCSISIEGEAIEIASMTSAQWREFIAGRKSWSISTSHLVTHGILLSAAELVNQKVKVSFAFSENPVRVAREHTEDGASMVGNAIITQCQIDAQVGALAKGAFTFKGTGELTTNNHYTYFVPQGKQAFYPDGSEVMITKKYND